MTSEITQTVKLSLNPITLNEDYCKKWNAYDMNFVLLTNNDVPISNTLYRVGGLGKPNLNSYFMLIKYVEAYYPPDIMKMTKSKDNKHLEGRWVIIDKYGVEKVELGTYKHGYLVENSILYSIDNKYYNIETGYLYCQSYTKMLSSEFIFLNNEYDDDKSRRGIMKINKLDGSFELIK